jgi:endonuclease YncB( thermonuclease family)
MPLLAIPGTFRILGASPDGDSIRFYPDDRAAFAKARLRVRTNASGGAQLRLDAIDALETHYTPRSAPAPWHQPVALGNGAAGALLDLLGFTEVQRDSRGTVVAAHPEQRPGYILTRSADKYGRAVSFAYAGPRDGGTDAPVFLDLPELRRSLNHRLLGAGWVYPTFYSKLYVDLRNDLAATAVAARNAKAGVWADDTTLTGFTVASRQQLQGELVILPKLFRRLADYLTLDHPTSVDLDGLLAFLAARDDRLFTVPAGQATSLDTLVHVAGQTVTLTIPPEQIVFLEA